MTQRSPIYSYLFYILFSFIYEIALLLLLLLLFGVRCARPGESENTLSVQTSHNQPMEGRKDKKVGEKKERAGRIALGYS